MLREISFPLGARDETSSDITTVVVFSLIGSIRLCVGGGGGGGV